MARPVAVNPISLVVLNNAATYAASDLTVCRVCTESACNEMVFRNISRTLSTGSKLLVCPRCDNTAQHNIAQLCASVAFKVTCSTG